MTGKSRLTGLEFAGATIVRSRLMSLTLTGASTGGKSRLMSLTLTADAGSTPPATKKSRLMSLTMTGENNTLAAALSIIPSGPLEPGQQFMLTAAASTGAITGWSFSQTAGTSCPGGLPGSLGTRYGVAPLTPPTPVYTSGVWTGDTPNTISFEVEITDGVFTDTATVTVEVYPHLMWTKDDLTGTMLPLVDGGVIPLPGPDGFGGTGFGTGLFGG